jgi:hypothetical protein
MRKAILLLAVFGFVASLWAADPFLGTWKMNPAKSRYSSPLWKSYTIKIEAQDNGEKAVQDFVDADGKATHRSWAAKYDGKDYPVTAPDADAISLKKPNANTIEYVVKKNGKEAWSGRAVVSMDGKTFTDAGGGRDAKGQAFTYSIFLEKQ